MGRKRREINPVCGKRLKELIEQSDMTEAELAKRVHYSQQHLSRVVNGKSMLSNDAAILIAKEFPGVTAAWLLGIDDRKTIYDVAFTELSKIKKLADSISEVIEAAATYLGYDIVYLEDKERRKSNISFFLKEKKEGGSQIAFDRDETVEIGDDIIDYAAFLLRRGVRKKKGLPNPSSAGLGDIING